MLHIERHKSMFGPAGFFYNDRLLKLSEREVVNEQRKTMVRICEELDGWRKRTRTVQNLHFEGNLNALKNIAKSYNSFNSLLVDRFEKLVLSLEKEYNMKSVQLHKR